MQRALYLIHDRLKLVCEVSNDNHIILSTCHALCLELAFGKSRIPHTRDLLLISRKKPLMSLQVSSLVFLAGRFRFKKHFHVFVIDMQQKDAFEPFESIRNNSRLISVFKQGSFRPKPLFFSRLRLPPQLPTSAAV